MFVITERLYAHPVFILLLKRHVNASPENLYCRYFRGICFYMCVAYWLASYRKISN